MGAALADQIKSLVEPTRAREIPLKFPISSKNHPANRWRMIAHTNQPVVPVTAIEDRAEVARLTLQTLESRGWHDAELARNAVVIVPESTDAKRRMSGDALKRAKDEARRIAEGFAPHVRALVRIPYDLALVNGPIRYDALQPTTQRAWLAAAAAVAQRFLGDRTHMLPTQRRNAKATRHKGEARPFPDHILKRTRDRKVLSTAIQRMSGDCLNNGVWSPA